MLQRMLFFVLVAAASACGDGARTEPAGEPPAAQLASAPRDTPAPAAQAPRQAPRPIVATPVAASALPAAARVRGHVLAARRWTDGLGENFLILTDTDAFESQECCGYGKELFAYHYVQRDTGLALLWRTRDFIHDCDVDMTVQMGDHTLAITDLDADGVAESTFLYILACRGDVSAAAMKLIMHEGTEKYAIRGTTDEDPRMPHADPSKMNVDPAFDFAPAAFESFAVAHWKKFTSEAEWRDREEARAASRR